MTLKHTKYGPRYNCPVLGCTVVWWARSHTSPADQETRNLRIQAHTAIDPIWREHMGGMRRENLYRLLVKNFGVNHIGFATAEQCRDIIKWAEQYREMLSGKKKRRVPK